MNNSNCNSFGQENNNNKNVSIDIKNHNVFYNFCQLDKDNTKLKQKSLNQDTLIITDKENKLIFDDIKNKKNKLQNINLLTHSEYNSLKEILELYQQEERKKLATYKGNYKFSYFPYLCNKKD